MQCTQFRQIIGAEPARDSAEIATHRAECSQCAEYGRQMLELDRLLKRALELHVPAQAILAVRPSQSRNRWYAMAAGLLVAIALGISVWLAAPQPLAAADLVAHIEKERQVLHETDKRTGSEQFVGVLNRAGVTLDPLAPDVSFASTCPVHGKRVPHLVVQTANGPVTVIVLPREPIESTRNFDEGGYVGVWVPSGPGSVAVIAHDESTVRDATARVMSAIKWIP